MKKFTMLMMVFLVSLVVTACGGGKGKEAGANNGQDQLIVDKGRGTLNGHQTEVPSKKH